MPATGTSQPQPAQPRQPDDRSINFLGILSILICILLVIIYFAVRKPTVDILGTDILTVLPYLFVGGISSILALLDLYDRFPDFGLGLPLSNKYGLGYLLLGTFSPMLLLYGYLNYFVSVLNFPKIGDAWTTSFVVALAFPLLIRSKFFTYTNSTGDNVSVGFDQLYDRLVGFFVRQITISSKSQERRDKLVRKCAEVFGSSAELKDAADMLVLTHADWKEERKQEERDKIAKILSSSDTEDMKKCDLANYILVTNGEDYLREITLGEETDINKREDIRKTTDNYKASVGKSPSILWSK